MSADAAPATASRPPGPRSPPLLGARCHALPFALDPADWLTKLHGRYGELACLPDRREPIVFGFGLAHNRQIHSDVATFEVDGIDSLPALRERAGARALMSGLSMMNGPRHQAHRRLMLPPLSRTAVTRYVGDVVQETTQMLKAWRREGPRELHADMFRLARAIGVRSLLGLDPSTEGRLIGDQVDATIDGLFSPLSVVMPLNLPGTPFARALRKAAGLEHELRAMIERRKRRPPGPDLLSLLIHANQHAPHASSEPSRMTDDELIGHTLTLFRGAYPSTALALSWTLILLATHPPALARVHEELARELAGAAPTSAALGRLRYLEAALLEGMRLFPAALWLSRVASTEFELGGFEFPARARVFSCPLLTHRRADVYPRPMHFQPDRFVTARPGAYSYLAFSTGPRRCVGAEFAMMSMKVALAMILQSHHVRVPDRARIRCKGLRGPLPAGGLPVEILRRRPGSPPPPPPRMLLGNLEQWVDVAHLR